MPLIRRFSRIFQVNNTVISGFNTDVKFEDVVYHIQTEDKGLKSRLIVSLVYDGGTVLASKRVSYNDLANGAFDENELGERVQRQHKLICAAIKAGRIAELKEMAAGDRKTISKPRPEPLPLVFDIPSHAPSMDMPQVQRAGVAEVQNVATLVVEKGESDLNIEIIDDEPIFEGVSIIEDDAILPPEAVAVVSELSGTERPTNTKLSLELLGDTKFKGGDRRTVNIMVCRGTDRKVIRDAQIMIKVLGSSFRPMIFHAKSDANGLAKVHLQLPHFQAGRAAILIRAMSEGEEIELRRVITSA